MRVGRVSVYFNTGAQDWKHRLFHTTKLSGNRMIWVCFFFVNIRPRRTRSI